MMSSDAELKWAEASEYWPPMECASKTPPKLPKRYSRILKLKGFGGGVPLNTETTAVKPRVGIE
jgi:hypothetical protein